MIKLIINADDYGMNPNCTKAITECLCNGSITNTTLMVNMPSCEEAVEQARKHDLLDHIGLHLNYTEGVPLTEGIRENREFCDENGVFNWRFRSGRMHLLKPLSLKDKRDLSEETEAQVRRYLELGLPVKHFDAHHHSHLVSRVIPTVFAVAAKFGFKSVRRPVNLKVWQKLRSKIYYPLNSHYKMTLMRPFGFVTSDYMGAFADFRQLFQTLPDSSSMELMVHPMYLKDGQLDLRGGMSDSGLRPMVETLSFISAHSDSIKKISFKDLQEASL